VVRLSKTERRRRSEKAEEIERERERERGGIETGEKRKKRM